MNRNSTLRTVLTALIVLTTVFNAVGVAAAAPAQSPATLDTGASPAVYQVSNNSTTTSTATPTNATAPTSAEQARFTPETFDGEQYLSVETKQRDSSYTTTGPFALFLVSEKVDSVRIAQPKASARVLDGGRSIKVEYADDAAPPNQQSLYTLEVFFADGSQKAIQLYAKKTDVSVEAAELSNYASFIDDMCADAEDHGYECSPAGVEAYHEEEKEQADLLNNWLSEKAAEAAVLAFAAAQNWVVWVIVLGLLALAAKWFLSNYDKLLDMVMNDPGRASRTIEQLEIQKQRQMKTAVEEPLSNVDAVGNDGIYWDDAFGCKSPAHVANLAARGMARRDAEGELEAIHGGVTDLHADSIRQSWLEPILRSNRIPTPIQALGHMRACCKHMESKYGQGHLYRDAADECDRLIDDLREKYGLATHGPKGATADD